MSVIDCQVCGGTHWGSIYCPFTDKGREEIRKAEEAKEKLEEQKKKMTIQYYPEELVYVTKKLTENPRTSSFLNQFLESCLRADSENYEIVRPALQTLMRKYPLRGE